MTSHSGQRYSGSVTCISFKKSISFGFFIVPASENCVINQKSIVVMPPAVIKYMLHRFYHLGNKQMNKIIKMESKNIRKATGISNDLSTFFRELFNIRQLQGVSEVSDSFSSRASFRLFSSSARSKASWPLLSLIFLIAPFISKALSGRPLPSWSALFTVR